MKRRVFLAGMMWLAGTATALAQQYFFVVGAGSLELREDGTSELREDGTVEIREINP